MLLGYARVSKAEGQDTRAQVDALRAAGCERIYEERMSGGRWDRPELHRLLDQLRPGDVLVVWKLDRLSRSLRDLLHIVEHIEKAGAGFRSLTEAVETVSPAGRMLTGLLSVFSEYEKELTRERTRAGLQKARREGRVGGRKPKLSPAQRRAAIEMVSDGKTAADVARLFGVHPSTITRLLTQLRQDRCPPESDGSGIV